MQKASRKCRCTDTKLTLGAFPCSQRIIGTERNHISQQADPGRTCFRHDAASRSIEEQGINRAPASVADQPAEGLPLGCGGADPGVRIEA
jgi:hypothetical protein